MSTVTVVNNTNKVIVQAVGSPGPQGPSTYTFEGAWSSATAYTVNDVVTYNGSSYVAKASTTNEAPDSNPTKWQLLAQKGNDGAAGADGADGADGAPGAPGADGADGAPGADGVGVPAGGTAKQILRKVDGTDYNTEWADLVVNSQQQRLVFVNSSDDLEALPALQVTPYGSVQHNLTDHFDDAESHTIVSDYFSLIADEDASDTSINVRYLEVEIDHDDDGFDFGLNGSAVTMSNFYLRHEGLSDVGSLTFYNNSFLLGNGTDPIDVKGVAYMFGFGEVKSGVTMTGPFQGYIFQPTVKNGATIDQTGSYTTAFGDFMTYEVDSSWHTSFAASPTIENIPSTKNYTGLNINPTIDAIAANAGVNAIAIGGNYGVFGSGSYFNGVNVNPNIDEARYASGLEISMDNVTPYAGVQSSVVIQDLTITFNAAGDNDSYSIEYIDGATAGSETVALNGNNIEVTIEDGVSNANQVKAAIEATIGLNAAVTVTVSGVGTNAQVVAGPISFSGGENPGQVLAARFDGDVQITGSLSFGGALSIGKLNAFHTQAMVNGGGTPTSIHSLISGPTVAANATVALADTIGVNTAMLLTIGANATVTSALLGASALALPAVVSMGVGSTIDLVSGATFAVSLDAGGAGGTIAELPLCRAVALPNGVTTINNLYGFKSDLPFGDPGTDSFGFYERDFKGNYLQSNLLIGGAPSSDDKVTNSSVALEIKSTTKAFLPSRMTTTERDALTAVNGMVIYNTSTDKFQGYAAATWVDLH